ncbi:MAG: hypothetical protein DRP58_07135, partial [Spirochaetes bacterium]
MLSNIKNIITQQIYTSKNFQDLAEHFVKNTGTVLLLSGGDHKNARYNILTTEPWLKISSKGSDIFITDHGETAELKGNPFDTLQEITTKYREMYRKIFTNVENPNLIPI